VHYATAFTSYNGCSHFDDLLLSITASHTDCSHSVIVILLFGIVFVPWSAAGDADAASAITHFFVSVCCQVQNMFMTAFSIISFCL